MPLLLVNSSFFLKGKERNEFEGTRKINETLEICYCNNINIFMWTDKERLNNLKEQYVINNQIVSSHEFQIVKTTKPPKTRIGKMQLEGTEEIKQNKESNKTDKFKLINMVNYKIIGGRNSRLNLSLKNNLEIDNTSTKGTDTNIEKKSRPGLTLNNNLKISPNKSLDIKHLDLSICVH